jgi:tetratricopeptide (TPR) repeat protein
MANASRAGGDRRQAEAHFRHVRYLVTTHSVTDTAVLARIDDLEGSLRMDLRQLSHAEDLFTRAVMLYRLAESRVDMARVLLKLGAVYDLQGKSEQAVEVTRAALHELSPEREPRLYMNGRYNLALFLVESGEPEQAAEVLEADADLYKRYPEPWVQLRLTGLRGKIAQARGDFEDAEAAFLRMREGFLQEGLGFDAAIVSMDLALLYLRQGRMAELKGACPGDAAHLPVPGRSPRSGRRPGPLPGGGPGGAGHGRVHPGARRRRSSPTTVSASRPGLSAASPSLSATSQTLSAARPYISASRSYIWERGR